MNATANAQQTTVVISKAKMEELREKLRRFHEQQEQEEKALAANPAPMTLPAPQTQPENNVDAENAHSDTPTAAQIATSPSMRALGYDLSISESPSVRTSLDAEPIREKPRSRNSVGW